jgi:(p)ppGpp synthase/HD superfamily hydrolase
MNIDEIDQDLWDAIEYCKAGHDAINQKRKYIDQPYWIHPIAVMKLVMGVPHTREMLYAALFHDLVEDTKVTLEDIRTDWGDKVAELVEMLTDNSKPEDGNRAARKAIDIAHTARASAEAKTIKLADLIHNTTSIVEHDKSFATVYLKEKALMLPILIEGDTTLHARAFKLLQDGELELMRAALNQ